ncbi:DUF432 domain-containing protein [Pontiellaceae bacterium B12227]|nr:DUF432 domain-containing protein [Pontiellaceae bacterium B12227]
MMDYSDLWKTLALARGQTVELDFGALQLQVHRGLQDWHLAHETITGSDEKLELRVHDAPFDADRDWTRWILDEKIDELRFQPQLPDRPIIVRPEMPMCLMPKQSVQLFIGLPIWLSLIFGSRQEQAIEVPSMTLSNSWFGPFTEGELCYALKTTAKLRQHELKQRAHRAVFALEIKNASSEKLKFERLCVRPQFLNIFQGESRLWTSKGRVSYRGEENWSRIIYASGPPGFDHAEKMVGRARDSMKRGSLLRTFDSFKQRVEI